MKYLADFILAVGAVVVGGVLLEHVVRTMDAGRFHLGEVYWRPGSEAWKAGQQPTELRRGLAPPR